MWGNLEYPMYLCRFWSNFYPDFQAYVSQQIYEFIHTESTNITIH